MVVAQRQTGEEGKRRKKKLRRRREVYAALVFFLSCFLFFFPFPKVTPDPEETYVSKASPTFLRELETNPRS